MRLPQKQLAEVLDVPQPHLSQMESGLRAIPASVGQKVLFMTGFSPSFFDDAPQFDVPSGSIWYRKTKDKYRKSEANQAYCRLIFNVFEPLVKLIKAREPRLPRLTGCTPFQAASVLRSALGLNPSDAIENLTYLAEKIGVRIVSVPEVNHLEGVGGISQLELDEEPDDFRAFSFWTDNGLPVIFIRQGLANEIFQWDLAHELIHLVMHSYARGDVRKIEKECQLATGEFLVPEKYLKEMFPSGNATSVMLARIAKKWNVGFMAIVLRCESLKLLNDHQKRYHLSSIYRGTGNAVPVRVQKPRFYRQICEVIFGKPLDVTKVAKTTGVSKSLIREVLEAHSGNSDDLL
jgi:Zn-dependent peptidase ImmA (M78 family)/transcriptional regulator with XRE-family HTH domain